VAVNTGPKIDEGRVPQLERAKQALSQCQLERGPPIELRIAVIIDLLGKQTTLDREPRERRGKRGSRLVAGGCGVEGLPR
jgi:hypothetical protein